MADPHRRGHAQLGASPARRQAAGTDLPFAVIQLASGRVAGATRFMEIRPEHRGLEIGGTWYGLEFQRTVVNTECKYLLLRHAFEVLGAIRVQFKADVRNERSWRAIERLGAKREGILRNHMILPDGVIRDSVYYSIIDSEWPGVKQRLEDMLKKEVLKKRICDKDRKSFFGCRNVRPGLRWRHVVERVNVPVHRVHQLEMQVRPGGCATGHAD